MPESESNVASEAHFLNSPPRSTLSMRSVNTLLLALAVSWLGAVATPLDESALGDAPNQDVLSPPSPAGSRSDEVGHKDSWDTGSTSSPSVTDQDGELCESHL